MCILGMYKYIEMFIFNVQKMKLSWYRVKKRSIKKSKKYLKPIALLAVSHIITVTSLPFLKANLVLRHTNMHWMP